MSRTCLPATAQQGNERHDKLLRLGMAFVPLLLVTLLLGVNLWMLHSFSVCSNRTCELWSKGAGQVFVLRPMSSATPTVSVGSTALHGVPATAATRAATEEDENDTPQIPLEEQQALREAEFQGQRLGGRITWVLWTLMYGAVAVAALALCLFVAVNVFKDAPNKNEAFWWLGGATFVLGIIFLIIPDLHNGTVVGVIELTINAWEMNRSQELSVRWVNIVSSLGAWAGGTTVFVVTAILVRSLALTRDKVNKDGTLRMLGTYMGYIRTMLYVNALLVVLGLILMQSIFQWGLAYIDPGPLQMEAVEGLNLVTLIRVALYYFALRYCNTRLMR